MKMYSVLLVITVITWTKLGEALECYHCHQTSSECINGVKSSLQTINCTEAACFVLQYETEMPGVKVLAAYRGCHSTPLDEMLKAVVTEKHKVTEKLFHVCNYTLCNSANKIIHPLSCIVSVILYFLVSYS